MSSLDDLDALEREDLVLLVRQLVAEIAELRRRITELERGGSRPAAPFSKNRRNPNPRRPGRKPGEGEFKRRMEPEPTEPPVEVPLQAPLEGTVQEPTGGGARDSLQPRCTCGGCIEAEGTERVTITEMPRILPRVRAYDVATGRCRACGRRWRAQDPDVAPDQTGATAHLLRNIRTAQEGQSPQARTVGWGLVHLIRKANSLWWSLKQRKLPREEFDQNARALQEELSRALDPGRILRIRDPDNRRLLGELAWHHQRGSLLRFLEDPTIEPTNNRAERALRPAVIARKVSQCSKNHRGAHATAVITSILQTAAKHGMDLLETLSQALNGENPFAPRPAR